MDGRPFLGTHSNIVNVAVGSTTAERVGRLLARSRPSPWIGEGPLMSDQSPFSETTATGYASYEPAFSVIGEPILVFNDLGPVTTADQRVRKLTLP